MFHGEDVARLKSQLRYAEKEIVDLQEKYWALYEMSCISDDVSVKAAVKLLMAHFGVLVECKPEEVVLKKTEDRLSQYEEALSEIYAKTSDSNPVFPRRIVTDVFQIVHGVLHNNEPFPRPSDDS
jgi:hypothetical protein